MNIRTDVRLDKAQFFAWAETQGRKYELADGRVSMRPYATRAHNRVCMNILRALAPQLDATRFDVSQGDFAVETGDRSIRYADVMVEPFGDALADRTTKHAILLCEVLSSSTMHVDFHEKLEEYQAIASLGTYAICAQDEACVWVWTRAAGRWPDAPLILERLETSLEIPALGVALALSDIYRNVSLR